jgi:4-alpha-glucanotransferase
VTRALVREALAALGIRRFVLSIHDLSFPSAPDEDIGHGSPYARGAEDFFAFAHELGFDGIQLGPQGQTTLGNASPYDGSAFSRSILALPLRRLADRGVLAPGDVDEIVSRAPPGETRAHHAYAFAAAKTALSRATAVAGRVAAFVRDAPWAAHDAEFEALATLRGTDDFHAWPATPAHGDPEVRSAWLLGQALLADEHADLRRRLAGLELRLYGDLQTGLSFRDRWQRAHLFLPGFALGAPPSRTNPEGQPWGYPVLDPRQYHGVAASAVLDFIRARFAKAFTDYDGVRVDHPQGLVCPWVYDATASDPARAVIDGARLFETPAPNDRFGGVLAALAIARPEQIDPSVPAYHDGRVKMLDSNQIAEYAVLFDLLVHCAETAGRSRDDVLCEVLSTCPRPLALVMKRHGLGRFRVTQKANVADPHDGYRGENARPRDWTMIGNHDTLPLARVLLRWAEQGELEARAGYLASRLEPNAAERGCFASYLLAAKGRFATAMVAELLVGPAENVLVFWPDVLGEREVYNTPGVVIEENWTMRVPRAFREVHRARVEAGEAPDLRAAVGLALRARRIEGPLTRALG